MRKIAGFILIMAFVLTSSFAVAAENDYGTYEKGIITGNYAIYKYNPSDGFQNGDFSKGFMYWGTVLEGGPLNEAKLVTEDGNTYMQLVPAGNYTGIISVKFICNDFKAGDRAVVIYDWKGSANHQVYLCQAADEDVRIGNGPDEVIVEATGSGWNTSITKVTGQVFQPTNGNLNLTFYMGLQCTTDLSADTCFDNVRLGILEDDGTVKDLNGNTVGTSTQLEKVQPEQNASGSNEDSESEVDTSKVDKSGQTFQLTQEMILVMVLATAVVLFITFDVVLLVLRKKKRKKSLYSESSE